MNQPFPLTEAEQLDLYGRILNAEDRALCLKWHRERARCRIGQPPADGRHSEADLPEHISGPLARVTASLKESC